MCIGGICSIESYISENGRFKFLFFDRKIELSRLLELILWEFWLIVKGL